MSALLQVGVTGIGAWMWGAPDWPSLREVLRGNGNLDENAPVKPAAGVLKTAERRRAPDSVRVAVEVAQQACSTAKVDPANLPCVFASTYGELAITDYVCETLAQTPHELSPTKFHNSVLNAPAGYWTIAADCTAASSAITAHHWSFAAGLLEAAAQACAENTPVLFASCDVASSGPLAEMTHTTLAFGMALVLTPALAGRPQLHLSLRPTVADALAPAALALQAVASDNPANAHALALLSALTGRDKASLALPLSIGMSLEMEITP
ncbi:MAG: beta-ketoacyl synthase chain length factor [Rhodanobacteraceae bacterium]